MGRKRKHQNPRVARAIATAAMSISNASSCVYFILEKGGEVDEPILRHWLEQVCRTGARVQQLLEDAEERSAETKAAALKTPLSTSDHGRHSDG